MRPRAYSPPDPAIEGVLGVVRDLLLGGRHSRLTVAKQTGKSLSTADRWLEAIEEAIPGARRVKVGTTSWLEIARRDDGIVPHDRAFLRALASHYGRRASAEDAENWARTVVSSVEADLRNEYENRRRMKR